ncbi:apolipoprotein N-acyltransferase [Nostoc ellipsosporum NOK]|nr:apolipoprotein N-acyltransferase [Nostoc ellipsosporum NOK]
MNERTTKGALSRFLYIGLALISSLLLWAAWPVSSLNFLVFIAWCPLLWIEDRISHWKKWLAISYLSMLAWNLLVTWWVAKASLEGSLGAFFANSLIMCVPLLLFFWTKKIAGRVWGYVAFIVYWLTYEYIHFNWDLSWPWLALGNAFADKPGWIQWYEYTGATGGSLWILVSNVLAYQLFYTYQQSGRSRAYFVTLATWLLILFVPLLVSRMITISPLPPATHNIVVVQPNIDPWDEKFAAGSEAAQLEKLIRLSESQIDANTRLVVWPETAVPFGVNEDKIRENYFMSPVWAFLQRHPQLNLLTGVEGYREFSRKPSRLAREKTDGSGYFEAYNSAALLDTSRSQFYQKSRLVPGAEVLPGFLEFMAPVFEKFGGTGGGYARDTAAVVLSTTDGEYRVAAAVCYESVYGEYLTEFIRKGANIISVITNDGWWGNTPGYRQHMNYARLRAIETRRWVVRSANTGISCFIDPAGQVYAALPWDQEGAIKLDVPATDRLTFFVSHGDWISKGMLFASVLLIILTVVNLIRRRKKV